jgi:tetratricopeptide (TPR) repeat protein
LTVPFIIAVVALNLPTGAAQLPSLTHGHPVRSVDENAGNADLDVAVSYEQAGDYKTAATYFASAAKSGETRALALAGLKRAESALRAEEKDKDVQALLLGKLYMSQRLWSKAEDSYKAALGSNSEQIRRQALDGLADAIREQTPNRAGEVLEFVKRLAELIAILLDGQAIGYEALKSIAQEVVQANYELQKASYGTIRLKLSVAKLLRRGR